MNLPELVLQVGYHVLGVDHPKTVWLRKRFGVFKGREAFWMVVCFLIWLPEA